jgi:peptidoglycan/xylan/chitin deacetylase (PgdA/CDA1 family)
MKIKTAIVVISAFIAINALGQTPTPIKWPEGKTVAVSLSFDDGRLSQVDKGTALLDKYNVKATFYLMPSSLKERLEGWKKAAQNGHEIGNHSLNHPCSGNFEWSRHKAIENYSLEQMRSELMDASKQIE